MKTAYSGFIDNYNDTVANDIEIIQPLISARQPRIIRDNGVFKVNQGEIVIVVDGIVSVEIEYNVGFGAEDKGGQGRKKGDAADRKRAAGDDLWNY